MNEDIDLTKILKDCPEGEQFWSPMLGYVKLFNINQERKIVTVILETDATWDINANGTISIGNMTSPDIMLYPSKDQHDWSKFYAPWLKKEKFDPKTLKPFDKIIFKGHGMWFCGLFSHIHSLKLNLFPFNGFQVKMGTDILWKELSENVSKSICLLFIIFVLFL